MPDYHVSTSHHFPPPPPPPTIGYPFNHRHGSWAQGLCLTITSPRLTPPPPRFVRPSPGGHRLGTSTLAELELYTHIRVKALRVHQPFHHRALVKIGGLRSPYSRFTLVLVMLSIARQSPPRILANSFLPFQSQMECYAGSSQHGNRVHLSRVEDGPQVTPELSWQPPL